MTQCGILYPLQLWPGLHREDQMETRDETEETPRCLREGDDGEVGCSRACELRLVTDNFLLKLRLID